ncbi:MAG: DEAD/DEAH box helicase family protein, partial [Bacteroidaceae bacterium]|nr:DEAD/DEAH box helicase family protein [Bacteroidaceae bacterium]
MNRTDLHPYQLRAIDFIKSHPQAALFMEMGLGKSVCTLTAISDLILGLELRSVLVVGPRKVIETTWTDEVEKWDHLRWMRIVRVIGTEKKRVKALATPAEIYVIGRDSFVWLVKYYRAKMPFDMIVLDELTSFKSTEALRFKAMRLTRAQYDRIVGLTGTPAPNGYLD